MVRRGMSSALSLRPPPRRRLPAVPSQGQGCWVFLYSQAQLDELQAPDREAQCCPNPTLFGE